MNIMTPLNDSEILQLDHLLAQNKAMDLSELDGFFTALVSGPEMIGPPQWLPIVFRSAQWQGADMNEFERVFAFLVRHFNGISTILEKASEEFEPIFLERDLHDSVDLIVENWCQGYLKGISQCSEQWKQAGNALENSLYPILYFARDNRQGKQPEKTREEILALKQKIPNSARQLYRYWASLRPQSTTLSTADTPIVRKSPKMGRNELCPCGSGKKYKRCCGAH